MRAAELHDLGKVGIPDVILDKPGALNATQWELMRQHTILGERILNASPAMRPVAKVVRATHERWDGRGYPDGLAEEQIPLGARIVAVCDAYSAMIDKRPYASARSHEEACRELKREAGRQFDGHVVEVFLAEIAVEPEQDGLRRPTEVGASELDEMTAHLRELMSVRQAATRNGDTVIH
jgi:two-component system, cell cycle response regulator